MKKKLFHIHHNTSGNSGFYLNPIYDALEDIFEQQAFVNKYYPLDLKDFHKIFFSITEKNEHNRHQWILKTGVFRKLIRYGELKYGNRKVLHIIADEKPDIINYSLTNMPDSYSMLLKIKKRSPTTVIIVTCHDVTAFQETNHIPYKKIYEVADYLVVHNMESINTLKKSFGITDKKLVYHPFPIMDISSLKKMKPKLEKKCPVFLFIGVMRKEKGVPYLIDAWKKLGEDFNGKLIIAGYKPDNVQIDFNPIKEFKNVRLMIHSLSDKEYFDVIDDSDYVIFPYTKVGNSGVLSTVISMGKVPVTTQLPAFVESKYVISRLTCAAGDVEELRRLIKNIAENYTSGYCEQKKYINDMLEKERREFAQNVRKAYRKIVT